MPQTDIRFDFNYALNSLVGKEGLQPKQLDALQKNVREIHRGLHVMKEMGQIPFYHLPYAEDEAKHLHQMAKQLKNNFDTLVVLGIGGSALGSKALVSALCGNYFNFLPSTKRHKNCRVFIFDSIDPDSFQNFLDSLNLKKTLFNVISKSGETLETLSQFFIVEDLLKKQIGPKWKRHLIITTDPKEGFLRKQIRERNFFALEIPPGVGGRYSALSSVGLFPAAMAGIDILEVLAGARRADVRCSIEDLWLNPAYLLSAIQYLFNQKGKNNLVIMPYSDRLFSLAEWYAQLWAESIGKKYSLKGKIIRSGSTPIAACGPRDQHSQLQLYMEGPQDKFVLFITQRHFENTLTIPKEVSLQKDFKYLKNKSIADILQSEQWATEAALAEVGCPSSEFIISRLSPYAIGQLLFILEVTTAFAGGLYEVNPFDQPGVELGKKMTQGLLGKKEAEKYKKQILSQKIQEKYII